MKLTVKSSKTTTTVFSINPGDAFRFCGDYYIRLGANGVLNGSINALKNHSYAMEVKTGNVIVFHDEARVHPVKAKCVIKEEGVNDEE